MFNWSNSWVLVSLQIMCSTQCQDACRISRNIFCKQKLYDIWSFTTLSLVSIFCSLKAKSRILFLINFILCICHLISCTVHKCFITLLGYAEILFWLILFCVFVSAIPICLIWQITFTFFILLVKTLEQIVRDPSTRKCVYSLWRAAVVLHFCRKLYPKSWSVIKLITSSCWTQLPLLKWKQWKCS